MTGMTEELRGEIERRTLAWVRAFVVGLDLCPFARGPLDAGRVRVVVTEGADLEGVLTDLWLELDRLVAAPPEEVETTLLVIPNALADFDDYLDGLRIAEDILTRRGYDGVLQIASFHPRYEFEGAGAADPANDTNRSPYPMFHLLREKSVSRAVDGHADVDAIPERNAALLRSMDPARLAAWRRGELPED